MNLKHSSCIQQTYRFLLASGSSASSHLPLNIKDYESLISARSAQVYEVLELTKAPACEEISRSMREEQECSNLIMLTFSSNISNSLPLYSSITAGLYCNNKGPSAVG